MTIKQSDTQIFQFIRDLPGGNPPQYAKLLGTTATRINSLLHDGEGKRLVKKGIVKMAPMGQVPAWATSRTERGSLRAKDVDLLMREGALPGFITSMLEKVHPQFRDDALNFLRESLEHTSNNNSFQNTIRSFMDQDRHRTEAMMNSDLRIAQLTSELARVDLILEQNRALSQIVDQSNKRIITAVMPDAAGEAADA